MFFIIAFGFGRDDFGFPVFQVRSVQVLECGILDAFKEAERVALALGPGYRVEVRPCDMAEDMSERPFGTVSC